jgi:uncharacterized protein (TIGR02271 family)
MGDKETRNPETKIPVAEEKVQVNKRTTQTGAIRIRKVIQEREEVVDEPLLQQQVNIERVQVNRFVEKPVAIRQHNETTIIPVMEEIVVVEKRLLLKEELHITTVTETVRKPQKVSLRNEEVKVEPVESPEETPKGGH